MAKDSFSVFRSCAVFATAVFLITTALSSQQANVAPGPAIVQPGAPGHSNKPLTPATADATPREPSEADTSFMQGMIMHHSQAVEMTALLRTRSKSEEVQELGQRINISQTDEMRFMKQWLSDRGKTVPVEHDSMDHMAGMHHDMAGMDMSGSMPMMPGMLTPEQMKALTAATGAEFDHLFLTGMIQHHTGALTMVKQLFDTPGAGQDAQLFDFAMDVDNTQQAEIDIMRSLLKEKR